MIENIPFPFCIRKSLCYWSVTILIFCFIRKSPVCRYEHQSLAVLVSLAQAGGQQVIPITFEGKTYSSSKTIAQAFTRQFTACSAKHDRALRGLMRDLHRRHCVGPSYRPFDKRGVAAASHKKCELFHVHRPGA